MIMEIRISIIFYVYNEIWNISGKIPVVSEQVQSFLRKTEEGLKGYLTPGGFFEDLGLRYIGPVDGHNLEELIPVLSSIREMNTPVLLHVYTKKGRGVEKAENNSLKYYSLSGSDNKTVNDNTPTYSSVLGSYLNKLTLYNSVNFFHFQLHSPVYFPHLYHHYC